ncbi:MAG: hypothetical protein GY953_57795, partial [bacterium]|nr:hypothetical protein [bacterium]
MARSQTFLPGIPNIGVKADSGPDRSESGVGALLPWADVLWAVTYNSHMAGTGSGLGLYRIDDKLNSELVHVNDGTNANRFVHKESDQAFIGPYAIDTRGNFRYIPEFKNHRLTATMHHLTDPAGRVYMLTMEGLLYELDVDTLKPRLLFDLVKDLKIAKRAHFKGGCTGQDRVVVSNNGFYEYGDTSAGLFEWDGKRWNTLMRKPHMDCAARVNMGNVVFCTGWDESSVLFWALVKGKWQRYRLPKASHAFDHAWQTEWMRIREVETEHFLMDIHGMFYELQPIPWEGIIRGLKPVCQHLRIIPDFCAFRGLLALGGNQTSPNNDNNPLGGQPQAGIWFGKTDDLWDWGKPQGWGGVWRKTPVKANQPSDPFLMTGFDKKVLHLTLEGASSAVFRIEVDFLGNGEWHPYETISLSGGKSYQYHVFPPGFSAHWIRLTPSATCTATSHGPEKTSRAKPLS